MQQLSGGSFLIGDVSWEEERTSSGLVMTSRVFVVFSGGSYWASRLVFKDGADWIINAVTAVRNVRHVAFQGASQHPRVTLFQVSAPPPAPP